MTDPYTCNYLYEENHEREETFLIARWRRKSIETYIFKAMAQTADDTVPVCRWFVVSKINIEYRSAQAGTIFEHRQTTSGVDDCCVAYGLYQENRAALTDAELYALLAGGTITYSANTFDLYSVKTYLTLPTGTVGFPPGTAVTATFGATPCIDITSTAKHATVLSSDTGRYPVAYADPYVAALAARPEACTVKVTFTDDAGCVQAFLYCGTTDEE